MSHKCTADEPERPRRTMATATSQQPYRELGGESGTPAKLSLGLREAAALARYGDVDVSLPPAHLQYLHSPVYQ